MKSFKNADGKSIVLRMIKVIQENKAYLSEIDGLIGDGDHGMNMNKGFTNCGQLLESQNFSFTESIDELGTILFTEIGGSMGPIYGTIFMDMAEAANDAETIDGVLFLKMLNASLSGLQEIVEAQVGDKTLIDTLCPAINAFDSAINSGKNFDEALDALKVASEFGKSSTKDLVAKFGRSSRLGERTIGFLDAGAVSCNLILQAMADGIKELLA